MSFLKTIFTTVFCLFLVATSLQAQDRCATNYLQKIQDRPAEADQAFERWVKSKTPVSAKGVNGTARTKSTYIIPVVVHIIHNGISDETNISDEQIFSQIRVLNEDYNRENSDANQTPAVFSSIAGAMDVEFVLAKRSPEGLPTNGIVRVQGTKTLWKVTDNYALKSLSYWPAEEYLNIWVCNLSSYLGYAQFPQTTLVGGLENSSTNRLTDGVVISYDAFGSADDGDFNLDPKYNKGRTATHEIGHFFGLRHISGDDEGTCGGDGDYVSDTPDQASQNYNCPSHPQTTCSVASMFQNYLDYTNDGCMNIFTKGQVDRMDIILNNSPRRKSLLTSSGASEPEPVANDLGIKEIVSPNPGECATMLSPTIEIRNYGSTPVSSAKIRLLQNGVTLQTQDYVLNLDNLESAVVQFSPFEMTHGTFDFSFQILQTNGVADGNNTNNVLSRSVFVPELIGTPFTEIFNTLPPDWKITNPDNFKTWEISDAPFGAMQNFALKMNFYDYEDNEGEVDIISTPVVDLTEAPVALLLFDVSHARYQGSNDGLKVILITDCNTNINEGIVLYDKSGTSLATNGDTNSAFKPASSSDWRRESIDLTEYSGQHIQLAFVGVNDWGNNLYLDNIRIVTNSLANVTLVKAIAPSPVNCDNEMIPRLLVRNSGTNLSYFEVNYTVNGITKIHEVHEPFEAAAEKEILLPEIELETGVNELSFILQNPDFSEDVDPSDNAIVFTAGLIQQENMIPFREDFENDYEDRWMTINPNSGRKWEAKSLVGNNSVFHDGYSNIVAGDEAWLVSPVVDLSNIDEALLYFDISYALRGGISDQLKILASTGCSNPFDKTLATYSGTSLSDTSSLHPWIPTALNDWQETKSIDLFSLIGESEVRFAFVVKNNKGNNLYLDNIELFLSEKITVDDIFNVFPNPLLLPETTASIAFKLPELDNIKIAITDNLGKLIREEEHSNILNQILELPVSDLANGLYLIRVTTSKKTTVSKLVIKR